MLEKFSDILSAGCGMIVLMCGETIPSETLYGGLE